MLKVFGETRNVSCVSGNVDFENVQPVLSIEQMFCPNNPDKNLGILRASELINARDIAGEPAIFHLQTNLSTCSNTQSRGHCFSNKAARSVINCPARVSKNFRGSQVGNVNSVVGIANYNNRDGSIYVAVPAILVPRRNANNTIQKFSLRN